ncbi:unnamed protein product, partial [Mesorhabditis spiculigera]
MSSPLDKLPQEVKTLIPKENTDFCSSLTEDEAKHLKCLLDQHKSFDNVDAMMEECHGKCDTLHQKFGSMLARNKVRLAGLSDSAAAFSKEAMHYVCEVKGNLLHGKDVDAAKAKQIRENFAALSPEDQAAVRKNNPDIQF